MDFVNAIIPTLLQWSSDENSGLTCGVILAHGWLSRGRAPPCRVLYCVWNSGLPGFNIDNMGAQQSRPEGVIFYNENVPLQFSQNLVDSLESRAKRSKPVANTGKAPLPHEVEGVVRERVAEELNRIKEQQDEANNRITAQLSKQNLESKHNAVAIGADIEDMIKRVQRSTSSKLPAEIKESQQAVIECYRLVIHRHNKSRPLDCWAEVENFKDAVAQAQKEFCINSA
ncbi:hypothetical protein INT44_001850 [Umbelopsis vinacea]|uniref:Uncharacterized protein n=1 Tax=Umbelopsis vinacea TaxID=44442 RepID=A0A8H7PR11_9FUNG|nr:hypothetical protein INT44_001850 [Umbelopsis vinacea]